MRRVTSFYVIALALLVGLSACGRSEREKRSETPAPGSSQRSETPGTPSASAPAGTAKMSNSDLENAVKTKLNSDEELRVANLKVDADANKNEITLSGTVKSEDLRAKAVDLAKNAQPGVTVTDKIDVKPAA